MVGSRILDMVGNTPLLRLDRIAAGKGGAAVCAKAEFLNPSGSVKDRAAKAMIEEGLASGRFGPGKILLDATSGNTGIAYAMFCAALGRKVELCVPKNLNHERKVVLKAYGAGLIETDPLLSSDGAQLKAKELAELYPDKYFYPDQYNNPENWRAHYRGTAEELWEQSGGAVTHFVSGMGSCGTFVGIARRLNELNPKIQNIVMQPDSPFHGLEGMRHLASTITPGFYDPSLPDAQVETTTEQARQTALALAREEGLFVGISSGANAFAAMRLARELPAGALVATILCDDGGRYINDAMWEGDHAPS